MELRQAKGESERPGAATRQARAGIKGVMGGLNAARFYNCFCDYIKDLLSVLYTNYRTNISKTNVCKTVTDDATFGIRTDFVKNEL